MINEAPVKWTIIGAPPGHQALPQKGRLYEVNHSRKGTFKMRVLGVTREWVTGVIVEGRAQAFLDYNVKEEGEEVTVRDSLCSLTWIEE